MDRPLRILELGGSPLDAGLVEDLLRKEGFQVRVVEADGTEAERIERAEQTAMRRSKSLKLLSESATRLLMAERSDQIVGELFDAISRHVGLEVYFNYMVTPDGGRLHLNAAAGIHESARALYEYMDFGQPMCGMVAQQRQRVLIENVQEATEPKVIGLQKLGLQVYVCYPLIALGRLVGTLSLASRVRTTVPQEELQLLQALADQIAMALDRSRAMEELAQRVRDLAAAKLSAEQAKAAAERACGAKDRFLAVLSHELRTPLTPVVATVAMLQEDRRLIDSEIRELLELVRRNIELEARLIDDLLDVTKISRGKIELHKRLVGLPEILKNAAEVCRADFEAKRICLEMALDACAGVLVNGDPARLQQVFWNLIQNAIKFSRYGGWVRVSCRREARYVEVDVCDAGEGIDPELLPSIFNPFEQGGARVTRQFGGLGLGLTITKGLVELHGGTVRVRSSGKGTGAVFTVRLPTESVEAAGKNVLDRRGGIGVPANRPLRILLVEDHADTARIMGRFLTRQGNEVDMAGGVTAALKLAEEKRFDLLLSDLGLPDGSGLDLMRELRARGHKEPAIALTGYGQEEDLRRSRSVGFTEHLVKPVDGKQLQEVIEKVLR